MTFYTNREKHEGFFETPFSYSLGGCSSGTIATGYISNKTINRYESEILRVVENGGTFHLIVGMAFYEGLKKSQFETLESLHNKIQSINPKGGGVKLVYVQKFHGKIYDLSKAKKNHIYLGSSNFSETGLRENLEGTIELRDKGTKSEVINFLDWLRDDKQSVYIDKADISITDSKTFRKSVVKPVLESHEVTLFDPKTIDKEKYKHIDISLSRNIHDKPRSSLNVYFGKGRLQKSSGKITPRNWFEVEIIVDQETTRESIYPKGDFKVITDDGYSFDCKTQSKSNNFKNLRSSGDLKILGKWIKLKLQKRGALKPLTAVTSDTFELYGNDNLRHYKISNGVYYMEF